MSHNLQHLNAKRNGRLMPPNLTPTSTVVCTVVFAVKDGIVSVFDQYTTTQQQQLSRKRYNVPTLIADTNWCFPHPAFV
jgi:hypothetical protein